jgi:hypothetical protein
VSGGLGAVRMRTSEPRDRPWWALAASVIRLILITLRDRVAMATRARSRRYLKPVLGCLRRNRRRVFAAAVTRYLKSCLRRSSGGYRGFPRRQANQAPATEGDEGADGKLAGSGAISARYLACNQRTPGHRWQGDPARRAACGPSTGSDAEAVPFQHVGLLRGATKCPLPGSAN